MLLLLASLAPPASAADVHPLGPGWRQYARHGAFAAPGVAEAGVTTLVTRLARLHDVEPDELVLDRRTDHADTGRSIVRYERQWRGAVVVGDQIAFVITRGRIGTVWVHLTPIAGLPGPRPEEWVMPTPRGAELVTRVQTADTIEWRDRAGAVVRRDPTRFDATLTVTSVERSPWDPLVPSPARDVAIGAELTDDAGTVAAEPPWDVTLTGSMLTIQQAGEPVVIPGVTDGDLLGGTDLSLAAANVLVQYHAVRDWLQTRWPDADFMDEPVTASVDDPSVVCNATYSTADDHFTFAPASPDTVPPCAATGEFADVVHHEAGHRIHVGLQTAGEVDAAVAEGSADYVSATMADDPVVTAGIFGDEYDGERPNYAQNLEPDRVYPDDTNGEEHEDGRIWGSALWNLREAWKAEDGDAGVFAVDQLLLRSLEQGPELASAWIALLAADDDDGDASNGTPHDCELMDLMDAHGIGPGAEGTFASTFSSVADQASAATDYPVSVTAEPLLPGDCPGRDTPAAVRVWWTTDPSAAIPNAHESDPAWNVVELTADGGSWAGAIPRVPAGSQVRYAYEVETATGRSELSHQDEPEALGSFLVGDLRAVWCDDLEGDLSGWSARAGWPWSEAQPEDLSLDWEAGTPTGTLVKDPDAAFSGNVIWATGLAADYANSNAEYLLSPAVDLSAPGVMRVLTFQRWLRIEDGLYDQAGVWAPDRDGAWSALWTNPTSSNGELPLLEEAWSRRALMLDAPAELQVAFTLQADRARNYSGWNLDDVCVYELDDPDAHYRVEDLDVSTGAGAKTLGWTVPWVTPITDVAIVRSVEGVPSGVEDGDVVAHLSPAAPGAPMSWTDEDPPASDVYYAVFLASEPGVYWGGSTEPAGCGCTTRAPGGAPWVLALAALVARRRVRV